jgi:hypothetical protein
VARTKTERPSPRQAEAPDAAPGGPEIASFQRAAAGAQGLAAYEDARAADEDRLFEDARKDALRLLILAAIVTALFVVILLLTATDLARSAERAVEAAGPESPSAGS